MPTRESPELDEDAILLTSGHLSNTHQVPATVDTARWSRGEASDQNKPPQSWLQASWKGCSCAVSRGHLGPRTGWRRFAFPKRTQEAMSPQLAPRVVSTANRTGLLCTSVSVQWTRGYLFVVNCLFWSLPVYYRIFHPFLPTFTSGRTLELLTPPLGYKLHVFRRFVT